MEPTLWSLIQAPQPTYLVYIAIVPSAGMIGVLFYSRLEKKKAVRELAHFKAVILNLG